MVERSLPHYSRCQPVCVRAGSVQIEGLLTVVPAGSSVNKPCVSMSFVSMSFPHFSVDQVHCNGFGTIPITCYPVQFVVVVKSTVVGPS